MVRQAESGMLPMLAAVCVGLYIEATGRLDKAARTVPAGTSTS